MLSGQFNSISCKLRNNEGVSLSGQFAELYDDVNILVNGITVRIHKLDNQGTVSVMRLPRNTLLSSIAYPWTDSWRDNFIGFSSNRDTYVQAPSTLSDDIDLYCFYTGAFSITYKLAGYDKFIRKTVQYGTGQRATRNDIKWSDFMESSVGATYPMSSGPWDAYWYDRERNTYRPITELPIFGGPIEIELYLALPAMASADYAGSTFTINFTAYTRWDMTWWGVGESSADWSFSEVWNYRSLSSSSISGAVVSGTKTGPSANGGSWSGRNLRRYTTYTEFTFGTGEWEDVSPSDCWFSVERHPAGNYTSTKYAAKCYFKGIATPYEFATGCLYKDLLEWRCYYTSVSASAYSDYGHEYNWPTVAQIEAGSTASFSVGYNATSYITQYDWSGYWSTPRGPYNYWEGTGYTTWTCSVGTSYSNPGSNAGKGYGIRVWCRSKSGAKYTPGTTSYQFNLEYAKTENTGYTFSSGHSCYRYVDSAYKTEMATALDAAKSVIRLTI